jgi:hypothetical protein
MNLYYHRHLYHTDSGVSASAYNFAPVPAPGAAWLFLSELLGLLRLKYPAKERAISI